jgi:hypothetical protein
VAKADEKTITTCLSRSLISDVHRREIEKTLPDTFTNLESADKADFWNKLEQIKRAETPREKLAAQCEEQARQLDELARALLGGQNTEQMKQLSDNLRKLATTFHQVGKLAGRQSLRQCQLLLLWETVHGELGVSTPRKRKHERLKEGERARRPPHAPVIKYFQAAAKAVFGKTPGPDQIKSIVRNYRRNFSPAIRAAFNASLLRTAFGIPFNDDQQVRLSIDESKIFILRDGKLIDKDGNVVDSVG